MSEESFISLREYYRQEIARKIPIASPLKAAAILLVILVVSLSLRASGDDWLGDWAVIGLVAAIIQSVVVLLFWIAWVNDVFRFNREFELWVKQDYDALKEIRCRDWKRGWHKDYFR